MLLQCPVRPVSTSQQPSTGGPITLHLRVWSIRLGALALFTRQSLKIPHDLWKLLDRGNHIHHYKPRGQGWSGGLREPTRGVFVREAREIEAQRCWTCSFTGNFPIPSGMGRMEHSRTAHVSEPKTTGPQISLHHLRCVSLGLHIISGFSLGSPSCLTENLRDPATILH